MRKKPSIKVIKKYAILSNLFTDFEVSYYKEGYGNYNFLVKKNNQKYILRVKKSLEEQFKDSLEKEYIIYKFLEFKNIDFCPKALYYNKKYNFLIESFLEGEEVFLKNFSQKYIDQFAKQLYLLFSLTWEEFSKFCEEKSFRKFRPLNKEKVLEIYGYKRYELAKKGSVDKKVLLWIKKNLDKNLDFFKQNKKSNTKKLGLSWGDIEKSVILNKNKMYFYDFEHSGFSTSPGLSYIMIHSEMTKKQFKYLIKRYSYYSKFDKKILIKDILFEERITRVNDVVWAAMKWAETNDKKFKELTYKRIEIVEKLFKGEI